jgi:hypothetical protein
MDGLEACALTGIGSVCRRHVAGPDGILAVIDALDRDLPPCSKLHLFGVKSNALQYLAGHPRIHSSDSMAWHYGLRREVPVGRTQSLRAQTMVQWHGRQLEHLADRIDRTPKRYRPHQETFTERVARLVGAFYGKLALHGDIEYADARMLALQDMPLIKHLLPTPEAVPDVFAGLDHDYGLMGLREHLREHLVPGPSATQAIPT